MQLFAASLETPVGPMRALASEAALCALEFVLPTRLSRLDRRLARWYGAVEIDERETEDGANAPLDATRRWLADYFSGRRDAEVPPLDLRGAPFELRVWAALRQIPPGTTTSYGAIARALGDPGASRAVGMANGANPVAIIVPCHRVIGANGTLTGYGGGLDKKTWLLNHERQWNLERLF